MDSWKEELARELGKTLPDRADRRWIEWVADSSVSVADTHVYDLFCDPARDLISRGGKRWRPRMMVLIANMLGGEKACETAQRLSAVVEFPHNGSLIIDDIEDGSDVRRGEPAVHKKYGVDVSINAGNLLYYLPTKLIDDALLDDSTKLMVYQIYAKYLRRVHFGQGLDIIWHRNMDMIPTAREYEQMCRFKTGCLAGMSAEIGAAVSDCDDSNRERIGELAENIGVGFQIIDDVINLEKGNPGKQRGDDIVENKKSLPVIIYANKHPERRSHLFEVFDHAKRVGHEEAQDQINSLIGEIEHSGALKEARSRSTQLLSDALEAIGHIFPDTAERKELVSMVNGFIEA
jgi:octaprenyl-diphosphate synthase